MKLNAGMKSKQKKRLLSFLLFKISKAWMCVPTNNMVTEGPVLEKGFARLLTPPHC